MSHASKRRLFSISIFILVLLLSIYFFMHSPIFKVEKVYTTGTAKVTQEEVLALAGINTGQNLFDLDTELVSRALKVHPMIKTADVIRHLPNQVEVRVTERQVWALVPFQNILLCIDEDGVCIDRVSGFSFQDHPVLTMEQMPERVNLGQAVNPMAVQQIKKIWDAMGEEKKQISEFHFRNTSNDIILYTQKGTEIRFGNLDRLEEKIGYVKAVFTMEEDMKKRGREVLKYVDLRFDGEPVMKTRS